MNILLILIPVALLLGLIGLAAFLWSMKSGQFDDLEGAALRVLSDDDLPEDDLPEDDLPEDHLPDGERPEDELLERDWPERGPDGERGGGAEGGTA